MENIESSSTASSGNTYVQGTSPVTWLLLVLLALAVAFILWGWLRGR